MELRQLEYFVAVAEERHFTRAAQRSLVSQSGLSASIRALERELGSPLFVRSTRRVELTEVGRAVLREARRALAGASAALDAAAAVQGLLRGSLAVGSEQCIAGVDVPAALARFRAAHPGVEVSLRHESSQALIEHVAANRLDAAFVAVTGPVPDTVLLSPVISTPMVVIAHADHPLPAVVTWADLAEETFVDFQADWSVRRLNDLAAARAGIDRRVALEVNDVHSLLDLVGHDLGVAVVPRPIAEKDKAAHLVSRPTPDDPDARWCVALAVAAGDRSSPATTQFCRIAVYGVAAAVTPFSG
ncbi:LysR family transcriptional regulator [Pseudonocardia sp. GCM10023141]|uniref:LysR family transcriptional regulator n=1 Tax=Pseudonocardia sp. GCM10023141 TaxID=3252653 RepID=UPI003619BE87